MIPSPQLLQKLTRSRLLLRQAQGSVGIGERRSRSKGAGLEFADHRDYATGDDLRHLDPHIYARLGQHVVRQYEVQMQLPVTLVIDGSRSMNFGAPPKLEVARWLAGMLAFVALAGGDRIRIGFWTGKRLDLSPFHQGSGQANKLFAWLASQTTQGDQSFKLGLSEVVRTIIPGGVCILISDWWVEDGLADLKNIGVRSQEVWALQVMAPEERDPGLLGDGDVRLIDSESGAEIEVGLGGSIRAEYCASVDRWKYGLRQTLQGVGGRYLLVQTDTHSEERTWQKLRRAVMIG